MNALDQARTAYASNTAPVRTARGIEYDAFARITSALRKAAETRKTDFPGFVAALHRNRQLWTILATGVADGANALPQKLRAQIFYLAEFTEHHTRLVLAGKAEPAPLIEINTAIMQGLRGTAEQVR